MLFGKDMRKWALLSAAVLLAYSLCFTRAGAESITEDLKKCDGEAENHVIAGEVNSTAIDHSRQTITTQVNDEDKQIRSTQSLVGNEGQGTSEKYGEYVFTVIDTEQVVVKSSTAFMPVRQAMELCGMQYSVEWNSAERCAYITCGKGRIKAGDGKSYITLDGEYKSLGSSCYIEDSTLFVPLRSFAEHLGTYIIWGDSSALAVRMADGNGTEELSESCEELYWLSRIISAESRGEPFEGQIAVGNVIMARVASPLFPASVKDVIFDANPVIQFTPVENGTVYDEPEKSCVVAARLVLDGYTIEGVNGCLYFQNPDTTRSGWVTENCKFACRIANHHFYH